jgi:stage IV sporulation protein FB
MQPPRVGPSRDVHQEHGFPEKQSESSADHKGFRLIPIRFHFTFLILLAFLIAGGLAGGAPAALSALYIVGLFASVLLHEIGHVVVARLFGISTSSITLYPIGGISKLDKEPAANQEVWISLAGPLVNLVIGGAIFAYLGYHNWILPAEQLAKATEANLMQRLAVGNFILAMFNLIPAFPMDGGRALRGMLATWKTPEDASHIAAVAGQFFAFAIAFFALVTGQLLLIVIAVFIYFGAAQEDAVALGRKLLHGVPVRAAMVTKFQTLSHGNSLSDAADLLLATSQHDFPVVVGNQVIGVLDKTTLLHTMASQGPDSYVAGAMDRNFVTLDPNTDLADVIPMLGKIRSCALVMEGESLLGLLTRENLSEFLTLRRFGMRAQAS